MHTYKSIQIRHPCNSPSKNAGYGPGNEFPTIYLGENKLLTRQSLICFSHTVFPAPPAAPSIPSVTFHSRRRFTITWNEPLLNMGETVDAYFVNMSGPGDLCRDGNTLRRVTERSYTCSIQRVRIIRQEGEIYTITVAAANCGGTLRGPESAPALLQGTKRLIFDSSIVFCKGCLSGIIGHV